ncbi:hypothetical protein PhCBS80983_g04568 [Powellomyces hirtus]|uniref:Uncharacterized protein n=1 Tax=Powellomyces hirtus TaxID=109895 RepID=A0A507DYX3_9FUNG|nr:hypothetical protein PhCBS80983_g04568 [Powellomyces hirtus]
MTTVNVYNARSQLCNAFGLDGRWRCVLSGSNPYTSFHRPLDSDEEFHVINLYRSVSMLHILAIIEGLLVFGFAIAALVLGLALGGVESRLKVLTAALLYVLLFSACLAVGVKAVWAKLQLVEVGVTIPDTGI